MTENKCCDQKNSRCDRKDRWDDRNSLSPRRRDDKALPSSYRVPSQAGQGKKAVEQCVILFEIIRSFHKNYVSLL